MSQYAPFTHLVVTTYNNGHKRLWSVRSEASADRYRTAQLQKLGLDFIDPETRKPIQVTAVEIKPLPAKEIAA